MDLKRLEELYQKTTPGDWGSAGSNRISIQNGERGLATFGDKAYPDRLSPEQNAANAEFSAEVHNAFPEIIQKLKHEQLSEEK